jgi:hypothetical protein
MKPKQLNALRQECDRAIETSIKMFGATGKFQVDNYRLGVKEVLGRTRMTKHTLEECGKYFAIMGINAMFIPAVQCFRLQVDILHSVAFNLRQAQMFNAICLGRKTT